jgi:alpha-1,2-mannosidase, putative
MRTRKLLIVIALLAPFWAICQPAKLVNPFIGTGGHGHTYPGATTPFGMVQLSPDTRLTGWDGCSGYHYSDSVIYGFSHTHLSGVGCSDYGDILLMPTVGKSVLSNSQYSSPFKKATEKAEPGYYTVFLEKPKVKVELTALPRVGVHRYTFPKSDEANIVLDLEHRDEVLETKMELVGKNEVRGFRRSKAWANNQVVYFVIRFSKPFEGVSFTSDGAVKKELSGNPRICNFSFKTKAGEQIIAKVGISAVSVEGAKANLEAELAGWNFDAARKKTFNSWNKELSKIEVSGGTREQQTIFYTALYHCMSVPNLFMDVDGQYLGMDLKPHKANGFTPYTVFSLWDTFRAYHPLMTIIDTHRTNDFVNTFLSDYKYGGLLPVWELSGNETFCMIGYHSVPVIVDAYMKGIRGFDSKLALEAMMHSAMQNHFGLDIYRTLGCVPGDKETEGVSRTVEYAYDDWCIAQMAKALGNTPVYNEYIKRAQYYRNFYDAETGFMRPRINGGFKAPFSPSEVDFNFTEGNSWQYSFFVPQDINGLAALHGGKDMLAKKLDDLFTTKLGLVGREVVDITGLIGQYAHGNEPSHHMAYLYDYVGQPWKTQQRIRQVMDEMYFNNPDGLIGNEDCGQMSAWLVMSAMGFYPVCPGSTHYAVGTPWFPKTTIHLENGKSFTLTASNVSKQNFYIQSATLNGKEYTKSYINHADIMNGGELAFTMGAEPNKQWGVGQGNEPVTSIVEKGKTTIPNIKAEGKTFTDSMKVTLQSPDANSKILYTVDGNDPRVNGKLYTQPLTLTSTTKIRLVAVADKDTSFMVEGAFYHVFMNKKITIKSTPKPQYNAGGDEGLVDGIRGEKNYRLGGWHGYQGQDFEAVVDLGVEKSVKKIAAGFLQDARSWIMMPRSVEFYISNDNQNFTLAATVKNTVADTVMESIIQDLTANVNVKARYIKVVAHNYGKLPQWVEGVGNPAYIFIDEIIVE